MRRLLSSAKSIKHRAAVDAEPVGEEKTEREAGERADGGVEGDFLGGGEEGLAVFFAEAAGGVYERKLKEDKLSWNSGEDGECMGGERVVYCTHACNALRRGRRGRCRETFGRGRVSRRTLLRVLSERVVIERESSQMRFDEMDVGPERSGERSRGNLSVL